jgi:DNA invertase Pin-like site-specific DNA recombinase
MGGINPKEVKTIFRRFKAGESVANLAKEYKTSRETVYSQFRKHGFDYSNYRTGYAKDKVKIMCRLKKKNMSVAQIAKLLGESVYLVRKYLNLSGFILKPGSQSLAHYMAEKTELVQRLREAQIPDIKIAIVLNVSIGCFRKYFPKSSKPIPLNGK